jgi:hypothetical protein
MLAAMARVLTIATCMTRPVAELALLRATLVTGCALALILAPLPLLS